MTKAQARARIAKLIQEIDHHRYLYHVKDTQEISDAALDSLKHELQQLEEQFPDLILPASPTQRVAGQALPEFRPVTHASRMLSLQDAFSQDELLAWEARNQRILATKFQYFIEPKIDGVALSLVYQDGILATAATRGDGRTGEDVTQNIKTIESIPLQLRHVPGTALGARVEIRGEVYMLKKDFERLNAERAQAGRPLFANPRNIAAGSIRQLDPKVTATRPLRFFAWEIADGFTLATRQEEYELLQALGFPVPPGAELLVQVSDFPAAAARWEARRAQQPFQIDGLVLKINRLADSQRLGIVGKAPRGSIAYKFSAEEATTVVEDIVVQVGRTGKLTPVAHLKPVSVAGTTVSRATLHNADEVARKDVRVGDTVIVHKAGDIIPEIVKVLSNLRPTKTHPFTMPAQCPICGSPVHKDPDGVNVRCTNKNCFPQLRERILHAVGREGFDIDGLGEKITEQLLQEGLVKDAPDLWELTAGDLMPLERFAEKSAQNIVGEIQSHRRIPLARFLVALSIPNVGAVTAQDLAREFGTLEKISQASRDDFLAVNGIGEIVADSLVSFFASREGRQLIEKYRRVGVEVAAEKNTGPLKGKTFVFTGSLPGMSRDEAKQRVMALGGKVASTVGADVDYVVIGDDPGSKAAKAKQVGLTTLTPDAFQKMLKR